MGKLHVNILGKSFTAEAPESDEYLNKLTSYYTDIISTIQKQTNLQDPIKLSILAGITLVDKLYLEKQKTAELSTPIKSEDEIRTEYLAQKILARLDEVL